MRTRPRSRLSDLVQGRASIVEAQIEPGDHHEEAQLFARLYEHERLSIATIADQQKVKVWRVRDALTALGVPRRRHARSDALTPEQVDWLVAGYVSGQINPAARRGAGNQLRVGAQPPGGPRREAALTWREQR
jgi:hypothetical protein